MIAIALVLVIVFLIVKIRVIVREVVLSVIVLILAPVQVLVLELALAIGIGKMNSNSKTIIIRPVHAPDGRSLGRRAAGGARRPGENCLEFSVFLFLFRAWVFWVLERRGFRAEAGRLPNIILFIILALATLLIFPRFRIPCYHVIPQTSF